MAMSPEPYRSDLAFIHDAGFGAPALEAGVVLVEALRAAGHPSGTVVDLGCGSGLLSRVVADAGFRVHGLDLSSSMLDLARRRVPEGHFEIASIHSARLPPCVGVAAVGEVVNYLFDHRNGPAALLRLFQRVHDSLAPGGVFLLDAAAPGRVPGGEPRRSFVEGDGWAVLIEASEDASTSFLTRQITSFRRRGDLYQRDQETHRLRLFPIAQVLAALHAAGFRTTTLKSYGPFDFPPGWFGYLARRA